MGKDGEEPPFPAVRLLGRKWCSLARVGLAWVLLLLSSLHQRIPITVSAAATSSLVLIGGIF